MSDRDYSKIGQPTLSANVDAALDVDELHMRETLGLSGRGRSQARSQPSSAAKQRHRFVQDGEVQVIHLSAGQRDGDAVAASRGRIAALEAAADAAHAARAKAEQAVQAHLAQIHALETKLAHLEMASRETVAAERRAREQAEAELQRAVIAREAAEQALAARPEIVAAPVVTPRPKRIAAPKTKTPRVKEPKPVKWWIKSV